MTAFLTGGGTTGVLIRALDWSATPLGPSSAWPQSLRTSVSTCLNCSFPIAIWWGPQLVMLYNEAYAAIIGGKHPRALGSPGRHVWPEIWDTIGPMLGRVIDQGEAVPADDLPLVLRRHGYPEPCWFSFSYSPIRDEVGQVVGVFCPVIETTARILAERQAAALLDLERALRLASSPSDAKAAACGVLGRHLGVAQVCYSEVEEDSEHVLIEGAWDDGRITAVSGRHRLGDYGAPLIADLWLDRTIAVANVTQDPRTSAPDALERCVATHVRSFLKVPLIKADRLAAILFASDPEPRRWADHEVALMREAAERIWATVERRSAEAALRRSEEFRALAENLPNLCWMAGADGWIYWYNRSWYDYTGTTPADMEGWGWQSVHDAAVLPTVLERWTESIQAGVPFEMTFPLRGRDGAFRPFLTRVVPVRDAGGAITRWFGTNVDISEQQQNEAALRASEDALRRLNDQLEARVIAEVAAREQAQSRLAQSQRLDALGQLAGGIAHDFNNVLQAVTGGLGLIGRRAGNADAVRQLARMAGDAAQRGTAITGRLLAFARKGELQAASVPPGALLDNLHEILAPTLGASIQVLTSVTPGVPPLLADRAQLETVLVNLAVNARDAMPEGGTLHVAASVEAVGGDHPEELGAGAYVRLDLTDTGVGMTAATLARASEPFFTTKPPGQGTGLGLAMARGFAEQSDGGFALRSAPHQGTTVTLWFPQAGLTADAEAPTEAAAAEVPRARPIRVLVVDDDAMVRAVVAGHLEDRGYDIATASDGLDALVRLDAGEVADLLVTDFSMPGMNGLVLIQEARQRLPGLPALLLTGYADTGILPRIENVLDSATALLRKPVSGDELAACAGALLDACAEAVDRRCLSMPGQTTQASFTAAVRQPNPDGHCVGRGPYHDVV